MLYLEHKKFTLKKLKKSLLFSLIKKMENLLYILREFMINVQCVNSEQGTIYI
jgi:hypothetical protein